MKMVTSFLVFLIFVCFFVTTINNKILTVIELNRHGARTSRFFPESGSDLYFGSKDMQLTINGYRQHQIIGQYVKEHYMRKEKLISEDYNENEFKIISSATQRTIFSAAGFLSSLFPDYIVKMHYNHTDTSDTCPIENYEMENNKFNHNINKDENNMFEFKEIPIYVLDPKNDSFFNALKCKYQGKRLINYLENTNCFNISRIEMLNTISELKSVFKELNINFQINNNKNLDSDDKILKELINFYIPFKYHFKNKINLSNSCLKVIKKSTLNKWYNIRQTDSKYLNIANSYFYQNMLSHFEKVEQNNNNNNNNNNYKKLLVFSGHDTNIVNLISSLIDKETLKHKILKALDDETEYKSIIPEFASSLFFELHVDFDTNQKEVYYVNVNFNGKSILQMDLHYFKQMIFDKIDNQYLNLNCDNLHDKDLE